MKTRMVHKHYEIQNAVLAAFHHEPARWRTPAQLWEDMLRRDGNAAPQYKSLWSACHRLAQDVGARPAPLERMKLADRWAYRLRGMGE